MSFLKFKSGSSSGFTLIELLVVIAIIGILASVVLQSLNAARNKGSDAAVKSNLNSVRAGAEVVYDTLSATYGTQAYSAACGAIAVATPATHVFNDSKNQQQIDAAVAANGATDGKCASGGTWYVVAVPFKSSAANAWCIDSTGAAQQITFANFANGDQTCAQANS